MKRQKNQRKGSRSIKSKLLSLPHKKETLFLLIAGAVLVVVLFLLLLNSFGYLDPKAEERYFSVNDQCSLVRGNLIHQIADAGDCRIGCTNDCDVRELEFVKSSFEPVINDCNNCDCYCK